jgi:hypothetical protein
MSAMLDNDLKELFTRIGVSHYLKNTYFVYIHRQNYRWLEMDSHGTFIDYRTFEYVLDNIDEELKTKFLFHLDFFAGEVKEEGFLFLPRIRADRDEMK